MGILSEDFKNMIGKYIKYNGDDPYILRGRTRMGVIFDCYNSEEYDEDEDDTYEVLVLCVKINNQNFDLLESDIVYLSPEEVKVFQEQEKREAHADKYL